MEQQQVRFKAGGGGPWVWTEATHHSPPGQSARSCRLHLAKCCGIEGAQGSTRRSLCCIQTSEHLWRAEDGHVFSISKSTFQSTGLDPCTERCHTCHPSGEGKHDYVIESPVVFWVWRVKGQLCGRLLPEVYQEGGVDHGHGEAALTHALPHG